MEFFYGLVSDGWILAFSLNLANQRPYVDEEVNIYSSGPGSSRPKPSNRPQYHDQQTHRPPLQHPQGNFYLNQNKPTSPYEPTYSAWEQDNRPNDLSYDRPYLLDRPDDGYPPIDDYSQDEYGTGLHRPHVQHQDPPYDSTYRGNREEMNFFSFLSGTIYKMHRHYRQRHKRPMGNGTFLVYILVLLSPA